MLKMKFQMQPGTLLFLCRLLSYGVFSRCCFFVYNVSPDMSWFNKDKHSNAANNV